MVGVGPIVRGEVYRMPLASRIVARPPRPRSPWSRWPSVPTVIGRIVKKNGDPMTIIGVMPQGCSLPQRVQVWVPLEMTLAVVPLAGAGVMVRSYLKSHSADMGSFVECEHEQRQPRHDRHVLA